MEGIDTEASDSRQLIGKVDFQIRFEFAALILQHHLVQQSQHLLLSKKLTAASKRRRRLVEKRPDIAVNAYQRRQACSEMHIRRAAFSAERE